MGPILGEVLGEVVLGEAVDQALTESAVSGSALSARDVNKSFGSLVVAADVNIDLPRGVRYALIGPNGAGKTTLINLMTGMLRPDAGRIFLGADDITAQPPEQRVRLGLVRTFQINSLFPHLTALESVTLAVCERRRVAGTWWRQLTAYRDEVDEAYDILAALKLGAGLPSPDARTRLWPTAPARDRARLGGASPRFCCSTSRQPACRAKRAKSCSLLSPACRAI